MLPKIKRGDVILAMFDPRHRDDLRPSALAAIGRAGKFEALWLIEEGEYRGEWAMRIPPDWQIDGEWVPHGDLFRSEDETRPEVDMSRIRT